MLLLLFRCHFELTVVAATRETNKYLTDAAPWLIKGDSAEVAAQRLEVIVLRLLSRISRNVPVTLYAVPQCMIHLLSRVTAVFVRMLLLLCCDVSSHRYLTL